METTISLLAVSLVSVTGCVSQGKYDQAVASTETTRAQLQKKNVQLHRKDALLARTNMVLEQQRAEAARLKAEIEQLEQLDKTRAGEHAATRSRIGDLQKRLAELEAAQRASEARAALYRGVARTGAPRSRCGRTSTSS